MYPSLHFFDAKPVDSGMGRISTSRSPILRRAKLTLVLMADTHELHRDLDVPDADILIHAGAFTMFSRSARAIVDFDGWLGELPHRHKLVVPGKGLETFDLIEGVWVVEFRCAFAVVTAVRQALTEVWVARKAEECEQTKAEMVYRCLTGQRFRQRVGAIVESFTEMQNDLNRERSVMMRLWSKREEQILGIVEASSGMYGDLQGIAGSTLPPRSKDLNSNPPLNQRDCLPERSRCFGCVNVGNSPQSSAVSRASRIHPLRDQFFDNKNHGFACSQSS